MVKSLPLLRGHITLEDALADDDNMLEKIGYPSQRFDYWYELWSQRRNVEALVTHHLGLGKTETCRMGEPSEWISGSFNICVPIHIYNWTRHPGKRVIIRFPLPYRIGESRHPGNADEKLRAEVATFLWIQDNCPDVPIPRLWGFGFPGGQSFSAPENVPNPTRLMWRLRRTILSWLGRSVPCRYVSRKSPDAPGMGYIIMEYIEETQGKMLAYSWEELRHDRDRRFNLFKNMSRILLSLARSPLPQIGSLTLNDQGLLSLTNRPLTVKLQQLENEGIPTNIDRDLTYSTTDAYYLDLLAYHDNRIRHQPNSVHTENDGRGQMAVLAAMRAVLPSFMSRDLRHGPFVFTLTDLQPGNIFVDEAWNIKCIIDLEWACSRPIEMMHPPYWLTDRAVDQIDEAENLEEFTSVHDEFVNIFEKEEENFRPTMADQMSYTHIMKRGWKIGNFWYFHALDSPKGTFNLFLSHIQPRFGQPSLDDFERVVAPYWSVDAAEVRASKLKDEKTYKSKLRQAFEAAPEEPTENIERSSDGQSS
ncbi:MAG: hypothetical protein M1837_002228 [Sclerophora amabilis]|nr:MAG: hypothetical protein M1837_002228 [Sclerophora amabilis]